MDSLVASGRIVDLILVFVVVEAIGLLVYRRTTGRGLRPVGILLMLLPGVCLLFALRAALVAAGPIPIAAWLAASLAAHLADLWQRQRIS
jgi:hypothetical protein